jgi:hypothetical protein
LQLIDPEPGQAHRARRARLLALRQRRAQHLAERRLVIVRHPAAEADHRRVEGRLAGDHRLDVARLGLARGRRRRARHDETGHSPRAERHDDLRADRRRHARARIAVGERALHGQHDRDLEEVTAFLHGLLRGHFFAAVSASRRVSPARTSSAMSARLSA